MTEYSPLPGTVRSYDERAEFEEPCTMNRIGSGVSPALGGPMRLRQRLSATPPLLAQYSALQTSPSLGSPAPVVCACAVRADANPAPTPRLAPLRMVRRASADSGGSGLSVMASSDLDARAASHRRQALGGLEPMVGQILSDRRGGRQMAERRVDPRRGEPVAAQALAPVPAFCYSFATIGSNAAGVALQRDWKLDVATTIWWEFPGNA